MQTAEKAHAQTRSTMPDDSCPPLEQLRDYLSGRLLAGDLDLLENHLQHCDACEQAATEIDNKPDTLVELLQSESPPTAEQKASFETHPLSTSRLTPFPEIGEIASYELIRELGSGGMGAVYLARHIKLDKQVAVKLLPALPAKMPEFVARFEREMRAAGRLEHPSIVRTTDAGEQDGVHYLVMDAIDGLDLSRIARATETISVTDACEVARQAALGLAHAHENGIVHRDIKPSNLMLDGEGQVRILDFGLAQIGLWENGSAEITTVGQLMGTLDYMAPEQAERGGAVDYRADLYSLGATLFRLISGRPPLAAAPDMTPLEKLRLLSTHHAPKLSTLREGTPPELSKLVASLLDRDPSARPASASHAAELLEPFCEKSQLDILLATAKTQADNPETSELPSRLFSKPVPSNRTSPPLETSPARGGIGSGIDSGLIAFFGFMGLAAAAIWFIVDTGKGQLVIESVDANVEIKLRQDGKILDELRIEPGTKVTRLWGGKYEIVLDAGSDSFAVSNDSFTIRRGETVIARITPKQSTEELNPATTLEPASDSSTNNFPSGESPTADERLDQVVFKGETLDTWLRRVKFERGIEERKEALSAVSALASPELSDLVTPAMIAVLKNEPSQYLALFPLAKSTGTDLLPQMQSVFDSTTDPTSVELLAYGLNKIVDRNLPFSNQQTIKPLLDWMAKNIHIVRQNNLFRDLLSDLCGIGHNRVQSEAAMPDTCRAAVIAMLRQCESDDPSLTAVLDNTLWFHQAAESSWPDPTRRETLRRAIRLLSDDNADRSLRCQTGLALVAMARTGFTAPSDQKQSLVNCLNQQLKSATPNPIAHAWNAPVDRRFRIDGTFRSVRDRDQANLLLVLLHVIDEFDFDETGECQPALDSLHGSTKELPIQYVSRTNYRESDSAEIECVRLVFIKTGDLLGIPEETVRARLDEMRTADRRLHVEKALANLASDSTNDLTNGLSEAGRFLSAEEAETAIPVLKDLLSSPRLEQLTHTEWFLKPAALLSRVSGDQFFTHFTDALRKSTNPRTLLKIDLWHLREFECTSENSIEPLLTWADETCLRSDDPKLTQEITSLLSSLLRDRSELPSRHAQNTRRVSFTVPPEDDKPNRFALPSGPVAEEVQQAIIKHLESYPGVTDENFWLNAPEPAVSEHPNFPVWDRPLRATMVRHAMNTLERGATQNLACRALIVIKSILTTGDTLSDDQQSKLVEILRPKFEVAAAAPESAGTFHQLPEEMFGWCEFERPQEMPSASYRTQNFANETLLAIDVAASAELVAPLRDSLQKLHEAARSQEYTSTYFRPERRWRDLAQSSYSARVAVQAILLRTGKLLGEDLKKLEELPIRRSATKKKIARMTAMPGDTLAIYVENILPSQGSPIPVMQAGTSSPVVGYPIPVSSSGEIIVPELGPIKVSAMQLSNIRNLIRTRYSEILRNPEDLSITVEMLSKASDVLELRSLSSPSATSKAP